MVAGGIGKVQLEQAEFWAEVQHLLPTGPAEAASSRGGQT